MDAEPPTLHPSPLKDYKIFFYLKGFSSILVQPEYYFVQTKPQQEGPAKLLKEKADFLDWKMLTFPQFICGMYTNKMVQTNKKTWVSLRVSCSKTLFTPSSDIGVCITSQGAQIQFHFQQLSTTQEGNTVKGSFGWKMTYQNLPKPMHEHHDMMLPMLQRMYP